MLTKKFKKHTIVYGSFIKQQKQTTRGENGYEESGKQG